MFVICFKNRFYCGIRELNYQISTKFQSKKAIIRPVDRCPSGLRSTPGTRVRQNLRGFKSHPLRHIIQVTSQKGKK